MSSFLFLCILPAEKHELVPSILLAGGIPVIDISCSERHPVPAGAWVRCRTKRSVPGKGPVILCGGHHRAPIRGRDTWLEVTSPIPVPKGFVGIILRGSEAGGQSGAKPGLKMLPTMGPGQSVILDSGILPNQVQAAKEAGAIGIVLSDVLMGLPQLQLPSNWMAMLEHPEYLQQCNGVRVMAKPMSSSLRKILSGDPWHKVCENWFITNNPKERLWPAGLAAQSALHLAAQYPDIHRLLQAYLGIGVAHTIPEPIIATPTPTQKATQEVLTVETQISNEPIAIIGLGCRFPHANSIPSFWKNLIEGHSAITEVPDDRWNPSLFWDPDPKAEDKTYSKIGAFLKGFVFSSKKFRIPPRVAAQVDPVQQIALESVAEALEDANYTKERVFDRNRAAVILGNSMGGELTDDYTIRSRLPGIIQSLKDAPSFQTLPASQQKSILEELIKDAKAKLPIINEDSMPGELANVIAGRIANAFNLNGPNYTIDAACASSMAAIQAAVKGLRDKEFDLAITGGADRSMGVATYVKFSKIGALSADHSAPFDESASGFVMGEGCGILILKRLSDAQKDSDKIYAVIRGVGASSDGRGKGITAPNPIGQKFALERAYKHAEISPDSVELFECHGTSTVVGDKVEVETLANFLSAHSKEPIKAKIGSVKSNIGHLKSAAGAASLIKAALAIHHRIRPPSINFSSARQSVDFKGLTVQTKRENWDSDIRRMGVSAFGFGGTNFHIVMEQSHSNPISVKEERIGAPLTHTPQRHPTPVPVVSPQSSKPKTPDFGIPDFLWATSGNSKEELHKNISTESSHFELNAPFRFVETRVEEPVHTQYKTRVLKTIEKGGSPATLRGRGIFLETEEIKGKVAFLFTGQGSQYIDMGMALAERYDIVRDTFLEAEKTLESELEFPLRSYIKRNPNLSEDVQFAQLQNTAISQPATLTIDIAIMRLLGAYGISPDMVAGHSLGEYAAAVAAGIMPFEDALIAVCARGREMAAVKIDDPGKMASISAAPDRIEPILNEIPGYVVAANKNCAQQTVIAGESAAIEIAIQRFRAEKLRVHPLPVSHAFHSKIVSPASIPLKKVLQRLRIKPPTLPITTNVTGDWYPESPDTIINLLAEQVASPVEWLTQIETLYEAGARIFIECGPKRALTGFISSILGDREHRAFFTNHPKRGDIESFQDVLAGMTAIKYPIYKTPNLDAILLPYPPAASTKSPPPEVKATPPAPAQVQSTERSTSFTATTGDADLAKSIAPLVAQHLMPQLESMIRRISGTPKPNSSEQVHTVEERIGVYCSGASVGLPGGSEVFAPDNIQRLLTGDNRISQLSQPRQREFLAKNIIRLQKDAQTGQGRFVSVDNLKDVIRLAGVKRHFDLSKDYGIQERWVEAMDITTQLGIAAGIEALHDAGIPLVAQYRTTSSGKKALDGWKLPLEMQKDTGVIFASAFPGYSKLIDHIQNNGQDVDGQFDRRFLFQVLAMGHSQFAQHISALGPNTQVNAACASTTQAIAIGSDWIQTGRAERVIIIGSDDVTNDAMLSWIGAGFLAAGAATSTEKVEDAALPFDRRRHGMILGMGAVGIVLETDRSIKKRGMRPIARLLASRFGNSAFHGTRLLPQHIAKEMDALVGEASKRSGVSRDVLAQNSVFVSHETYTPAKGGSAAAEIESLRKAFGEAAKDVVIANTKGFTGHAMGAGIEDVLAVKSLQFRHVPPIPNLKEPDPDLGDLRLSKGEQFSGRYSIRLAAGFGSQLALLMWEQQSTDSVRIADPTLHHQWLKSLNEEESELFVTKRTLRWGKQRQKNRGPAAIPLKSDAPQPTPAESQSPSASKIETKSSSTLSQNTTPSKEKITDTVLGIISEKTGYEREDLALDYELEADLGIDTVKQAEVFSELQEHFGIDTEKEVNLAEIQTIQALCDWVFSEAGNTKEDPTSLLTATNIPQPKAPESIPQTPAEQVSVLTSNSTISETVIETIAVQTGYDIEDIALDYELEADLGIDTVKQAEIFSSLQSHFNISEENAPILSEVQTIEQLILWVQRTSPNTNTASADRGPSTDLAHVEAEAERINTPLASPRSLPSGHSQEPLSFDTIQAQILVIISQKTGYDEEDLDLTYELEADLGIDTVKQAEIFSELQELYGIETETEMNLSEVQTIQALCEWASAHQNSSQESSAGQTPAQEVANIQPEPPAELRPSDTIQSTVNTASVHDTVLETIADQTGYDLEDIALDYELEADLGIDTVKQAEIFSSLQSHFNIDEENAPILSEVQTIEQLIQWAQKNSQHSQGGQEQAQPPLANEEEQAQAVMPDPSLAFANTKDEPARTKTARLSEEPLPELPDGINVLSPVHVRCPIFEEAQLSGQKAFILGEHPCRPSLMRLLHACGIHAVDALEMATNSDVVIDLGAPLDQLFKTAKALNNTPPSIWICLTQLEAMQKNTQTALLGGRSGLCKSLSREWATCRGRVVDIHRDIPDETIPSILLEEWGCTDEMLETHHRYRDESKSSIQRYATYLQPLARPERRQFSSSQNVVLTGGARGITAEIAKALAKKGARQMVLIGRTPPGKFPLDEKQAKQQIKQQLSRTGRPTPKAIEDGLRPLRKAEEARLNIKCLSEMGVQVHFLSADVNDEQALHGAFQQSKSLMGAPNIVIHGAGLEESRMIQDKEWGDFLRVYTPKATAALHILDMISSDVSFVSMGSVAGRFGNPGQIDYSAANDAVAKLCLRRPNSLHIDWSAWADVGMASRGGMSSLLQRRGIDLLPPQATALLLVDMLLSKTQGEVLVGGALGDLQNACPHPFLNHIQFQGTHISSHWDLTVEENRWIIDHSINGTPVVPGVIGVELMAALSKFASPLSDYCGAENVEFHKPIKLHRKQPVHIDVTSKPMGSGRFYCTVQTERKSATGKTLTAKNFTGQIRLEPNDDIPDLPIQIFESFVLSAEKIYSHFFHGPQFQVLDQITELGLNGGTFEGQVNHLPFGQFDKSGASNGLHSLPLVLEAAFQAAGLHRMIVNNTRCLPAGFDQLEVFTAQVEQETLYISVQSNGDGYDVDIDSDDEAVLRLRGLRFADTGTFDGEGLTLPKHGFKAGQKPQIEQSAPQETIFDTPDWKALHQRGNKKRIMDRLAGRSAAKIALAQLINCPAKSIHIENYPSGQPFCRQNTDLHISISHCDGIGIAAAHHSPIGIDREKWERRSLSFLSQYFHISEGDLIKNCLTEVNRLWVIKEAVLKLLGVGLRFHPKDIEVVHLSNKRARISFHGTLKESIPLFETKDILIYTRSCHTYCTAVAVYAPDHSLLKTFPLELNHVVA